MACEGEEEGAETFRARVVIVEGCLSISQSQEPPGEAARSRFCASKTQAFERKGGLTKAAQLFHKPHILISRLGAGSVRAYFGPNFGHGCQGPICAMVVKDFGPPYGSSARLKSWFRRL